TGHPDHVAVHASATEAFHRARGEAGSGPADAAGEPFQRLFYTALPRTAVVRWSGVLGTGDAAARSPDEELAPRGVPDGTITHAVDGSSVIERKLAGLGAHR